MLKKSVKNSKEMEEGNYETKKREEEGETM